MKIQIQKLGQQGGALISVLAGAALLSLGMYAVTRTLSGASRLSGAQRQKMLAQSYLTEFAEYIRAKPLSEIGAGAMGTQPLGVSINDVNHLSSPVCTPSPGPGPVDTSASLPNYVLGGPARAQRTYTVRVLDLSTMTTSVPCGKTLSYVLQSPSPLSPNQRLLFDIEVAWKDKNESWQRQTASVIGGDAPTPSPLSEPSPSPVPQQLSCNMYIHHFGDFGCGPAREESFIIAIPAVPPAYFGNDSGQYFIMSYFTSTNPAYKLVQLTNTSEGEAAAKIASVYPNPVEISGAWGNFKGGVDDYMNCYYGKNYSNTPGYIPGTRSGNQGPIPASVSFGGVDYPMWTCTEQGKGVTPCDPKKPVKGVSCLCDPGSTACSVISNSFSPLIVDYDGGGIDLTAPSGGPLFDLIGEGKAGVFSWPIGKRKSMFLALDRNGNSKIDDIHELFGNNTVGPDGKKAANGFEALRKYDENGDGVIDSKDSIFKSLRLWADDNEDGIAQSEEQFSLDEMGVAAIDLGYLSVTETNDVYGNTSQQRSVVDMKDGTFRTVLDLWLVPGQMHH